MDFAPTSTSAAPVPTATAHASRLKVIDPAQFHLRVSTAPPRMQPLLIACSLDHSSLLRGEDARLTAVDLLYLGFMDRFAASRSASTHPGARALQSALAWWAAAQGAGTDLEREPAFEWGLALALESQLGPACLRAALVEDDPASWQLLFDSLEPNAGQTDPAAATATREALRDALPLLDESWLLPYARGIIEATLPDRLNACRQALAQRSPLPGLRGDSAMTHRLSQLELLELLCAIEPLGGGDSVQEALLHTLALRQSAECQQPGLDAASAATQRLLPCALRLIRRWLQHDGQQLDYGFSRLQGRQALEATRENLIQLGLLAGDLRQIGAGRSLPHGWDLELSECLLETELRLGPTALAPVLPAPRAAGGAHA